MAAASAFRIHFLPARAGLNAVADPQRRYLQAGTVILNILYEVLIWMKNKFLILVTLSITAAFAAACGSGDVKTNVNNANTTGATNSAVVTNLDPNKMPE